MMPPAFPATHHTLMGAAASPDPVVRARAQDRLAAVYWHPLCAHFRFRWGLDESSAEDLTQAFLAGAFRRDLFGRFDPRQARFRTYVRTCADRYAIQMRRSAGRQKRGGDAEIPFADLEVFEPDAALDSATNWPPERNGIAPAPWVAPDDQPEAVFEEHFHRTWVQSVFQHVLAALDAESAARGKPLPFAVFRAYDLHDPDAGPRPTYAQLAEAHGLTTTQVTNHLSATRRRFRELALATLAELCADEEEFRAEARALFGVEPRAM